MKSWKVVVKNFGTPDIIHAHVIGRPWLVALLFSKLYHRPFLLTEHWTGFVNKKFNHKPSWYKRMVTYIAAQSSGITAVSQSLKNALIQSGFKGKIDVIPNVVDVPEIKKNNASSKVRILTVADLLDEQKNVSGIIHAVAKIALLRGDFEFHIVGSGPDERMLMDLAERTQTLNSFVYFHGQKNNAEVYEYLNNSDFVVVNSNFETFSVVTAEALACGKPVVATISGGPEEIITSKTGILIEKNNEKALEEAIQTMLNSYKTYDLNELRSSVESRFSREQTGYAFFKLYNTILNATENGE